MLSVDRNAIISVSTSFLLVVAKSRLGEEGLSPPLPGVGNAHEKKRNDYDCIFFQEFPQHACGRHQIVINS